MFPLVSRSTSSNTSLETANSAQPQVASPEAHMERQDTYLSPTRLGAPSRPPAALRQAVAAAQMAPRLNNKRNIVSGAGKGSIGGQVVGGAAALIGAIPTAGLSLIFYPIGLLVGAATGGAAAVAQQRREAPASFGNVRKHLLSDIGVVPSRHASSRLIRQLKKSGVLGRGRDRRINDLARLNQIRADDLGITPQQLQQVAAALRQIDNEAGLYDAMLRERSMLATQGNRLRQATFQSRELERISMRINYLDNAIANFAQYLPVEAYQGPEAELAARAAGFSKP